MSTIRLHVLLFNLAQAHEKSQIYLHDVLANPRRHSCPLYSYQLSLAQEHYEWGLREDRAYETSKVFYTWHLKTTFKRNKQICGILRNSKMCELQNLIPIGTSFFSLI